MCVFPSVFKHRASAERGEAAETLPAEHNDAGADWLLHSHGRVLHERVCQQGQLSAVLFLYFKDSVHSSKTVYVSAALTQT